MTVEPGLPPGPQPVTRSGLADLWCTMLAVDAVAGSDTFFSRGGHSLLASRMMARLRRTFGVPVPTALAFETRTFDEFADAVLRFVGDFEPQCETGGEATSVRNVVTCGLTPQQSVLRVEASPDVAENMTVVYRACGIRDLGRFRAALEAAIAAHAVFGLTIEFGDDGAPPLMRGPGPTRDRPRPVIAVQEDIAHGERALARQHLTGADVTSGQAPAALVLPRGDGEVLIALTTHHMFFDGHSAEVLLEDVATAYVDPAGVTPSSYLAYAVRRTSDAARRRDDVLVEQWRAEHATRLSARLAAGAAEYRGPAGGILAELLVEVGPDAADRLRSRLQGRASMYSGLVALVAGCLRADAPSGAAPVGVGVMFDNRVEDPGDGRTVGLFATSGLLLLEAGHAGLSAAAEVAHHEVASARRYSRLPLELLAAPFTGWPAAVDVVVVEDSGQPARKAGGATFALLSGREVRDYFPRYGSFSYGTTTTVTATGLNDGGGLVLRVEHPARDRERMTRLVSRLRVELGPHATTRLG